MEVSLQTIQRRSQMLILPLQQLVMGIEYNPGPKVNDHLLKIRIYLQQTHRLQNNRIKPLKCCLTVQSNHNHPVDSSRILKVVTQQKCNSRLRCKEKQTRIVWLPGMPHLNKINNITIFSTKWHLGLIPMQLLHHKTRKIRI